MANILNIWKVPVNQENPQNKENGRGYKSFWNIGQRGGGMGGICNTINNEKHLKMFDNMLCPTHG